jgi:hypothetical protein
MSSNVGNLVIIPEPVIVIYFHARRFIYIDVYVSGSLERRAIITKPDALSNDNFVNHFLALKSLVDKKQYGFWYGMFDVLLVFKNARYDLKPMFEQLKVTF